MVNTSPLCTPKSTNAAAPSAILKTAYMSAAAIFQSIHPFNRIMASIGATDAPIHTSPTNRHPFAPTKFSVKARAKPEPTSAA
eukprot:CAMPEP_0184536890 /NCGR_PEP_ID=MMETSP0198_2-20121128/16704_1 /TAXON_ID=1112570 /ORGANISM="Thraustochytrium sp., Strain LLF1b" /LENGTH=82 /DNA_ID=CAMNT_0026930109 /DNA_START=873 /DNA_END=1117 /DNA_ORIENTATION=+